MSTAAQRGKAGTGNKGPGKDAAGEPSDVEQYLVKDPERFALNVARMIEQAGKAASAWVEPREKG